MVQSVETFQSLIGRPAAEMPRLPWTAERERRFWEKIDASGDCWLWTGTVESNGYGQVMIRTPRQETKRVQRPAHRLAWFWLVGEIPGNLQVDHLCRERRCCNPAHLELVEPGTNTLRGYSPSAQCRRQTHCRRGHPFSEENLSLERGGRMRRCKPCRRIRQRSSGPGLTPGQQARP